MRAIFAVAALFGLVACACATTYFAEDFDDTWTSRWTYSTSKEAEGTAGKFKLTPSRFPASHPAFSQGIQTAQDARFYQISAPFAKAITNPGDKTLVMQFTVRHEQNIDCGGGYAKILPWGVDGSTFNGDSPYLVMFGPDICGHGTRRIHLIFTYNGKNLLWKKTVPCETDTLTHIYTLIVKPDNTYRVLVDEAEKAAGALEDDWDFLAPKEIEDMSVQKPSQAEWDEREMIDDPNDVKPANWDDVPEFIADPEAEKPEEWSDEDGEWTAPQIRNPDYKGPWAPKKIKNPAYKGKWVRPKIANPEYKEDKQLAASFQKNMGGVGIEIWQVKAGTVFDHFYVGDSEEEAHALALKIKEQMAEEKKEFDAQEEVRRKEDDEKRKRDEEEAKARKAEEDKRKEMEKKESDDDDEDFKDEL
jgi:calreticulin